MNLTFNDLTRYLPALIRNFDTKNQVCIYDKLYNWVRLQRGLLGTPQLRTDEAGAPALCTTTSPALAEIETLMSRVESGDGDEAAMERIRPRRVEAGNR
jgi:hypothetical protein